MSKYKKFSIQLPESEYQFLKQVAAVKNTTMADLIRQAWFEKANTLSAMEDIEQRLCQLENLINSSATALQIEDQFKENAKRQKRIYQKLIELGINQGGGTC